MLIPILLTAVLVCFLPFYIWTEYRWKQNRYLFTKLASSLLFVAIGVASLAASGGSSRYGLLIIIALVLGMIGDGFLVYDKHPTYFMLGLVSFLVGQIVYGTNFLITWGFLWYDLLIYVVVLGISLFVYSRSKLELGEMKVPVLAYYVIITYMFTMAVSSLYKGAGISTAQVMVAVGAVLFLASDAILTFHLFHKNPSKSLKAWVLVTYYAAQALLALSIYTYVL